jgi:hypothetical protein
MKRSPPTETVGGDEQLLARLVPIGLDALAVLVLAHLLPTFLDQRTHAGDLISTISGTGSGGGEAGPEPIRFAKDRPQRKRASLLDPIGATHDPS